MSDDPAPVEGSHGSSDNGRNERLIAAAAGLDAVLRELCEWEAWMGYFENPAWRRARELLWWIDGVDGPEQESDEDEGA